MTFHQSRLTLTTPIWLTVQVLLVAYTIYSFLSLFLTHTCLKAKRGWPHCHNYLSPWDLHINFSKCMYSSSSGSSQDKFLLLFACVKAAVHIHSAKADCHNYMVHLHQSMSNKNFLGWLIWASVLGWILFWLCMLMVQSARFWWWQTACSSLD